MEHRADNPCDRIGPVLGPQRGIVRHMRALPHRDVAAALATVRASRATRAVKLAFEFLVVTATRSGEVRLATWEEMNVAGRVWTSPAERMKMNREHRVPLSLRALEVLDVARSLAGTPNTERRRVQHAALRVLRETLRARRPAEHAADRQQLQPRVPSRPSPRRAAWPGNGWRNTSIWTVRSLCRRGCRRQSGRSRPR